MQQTSKSNLYNVASSSENQKEIWLASHLGAQSWHYNLVMAYYIKGDINIELLETAFNILIQRHESLRTNFKLNADGDLVQIIHKNRPLSLGVEKNSAINKSLKIKINEEIKTAFDLENDLLIKAKLILLKKSRSILVIARHHMISDGWSSNIITNELSKIYNNLLTQKNPNLNAPVAQYQDFCLAQENYFRSQLFAKHLKYWHEKMCFNDKVLPKDHNATQPSYIPSQKIEAAVIQLKLSKDTCHLITTIKEDLTCSTSTILYTVFGLSLCHFFNRQHLTISIPVSGRDQVKFNNTIGNFVNVFPSLFAAKPNSNLMQYLELHNATLQEIKDLQALPSSKVKQASTALEFMFVQQIATRIPLTLGTSHTCCIYHGNHLAPLANFWLELFSDNENILCKFHYRKDLFDNYYIKKFIEHYKLFLVTALKNPTLPIQDLITNIPDLSIKNLNEQNAINQEHEPWPTVSHAKNVIDIQKKNMPPSLLLKGILSLSSQPINVPTFSTFSPVNVFIEKIAQNTPHLIAVKSGNEILTYQQLNEKANQLAHYLLKKDLRPGDIIALFLPRAPSFIIATIACLKLRVTYIPIDPSHAESQINYIIQSSQAKLMIGERKPNAITLPIAFEDVQLIFNKLAEYPNQNIGLSAKPEDTAYIIYTSGTTGVPKGVMVPHINLATLLKVTSDMYKIDTNDAVAMCHSVAFDFSVWEMFSALVHGARVVIFSDQLIRNYEAMLNEIITEGVTILNQTPLALTCLSTYIENTKIEELKKIKLRLIILGGDSLNFSSLKIWFSKFSANKIAIYNMYGITEGTIHCTFLKVEKSHLKDASSLIGEPLPGIDMQILDENKQPVPSGEVGEIYIGGYCLASGYLHQPDLTAQRFLNFSIPHSPYKHWLKTGDLGRKLITNNIEYLGRIDRQVKIRGYRIECGFIESKITQYPNIQFAYVMPIEYSPNDKRLVAYIVGKLTSAADIQNLKDYLTAAVPSYMIPADIILLDSIPLTINGKIDKNTLPKPPFSTTKSAPIPESPTDTNSIIQTIIAIWKEVINTNAIDTERNFFDNGGHSLLLPKLHLKLSKKFNCKISILDLFSYPTIREFAEFIKKNTATNEIIS